MKKKKYNNIITISGEPVSGKGTVVKSLIEKLENEGYTQDSIHVVTTGHEFRRFFNSIIEFAKNIDNLEVLKELGETEELQQILSNRDYRGILMSTISEIKRSNIDIQNFNIADANNSPEFADIRRVVDQLIDDNIKKLGIEISKEEHDDEIWIIDSRLAFHNIPHSFSIRLTANPNVAAQRLFNDSSRSNEDKYSSVEEAKTEREERRIGEIQRYKDRYGVDLENPDNYKLIVDTSYSTIEDISNTILTCSQLDKDGKSYSKYWASPKIFLPLQNDRETLGIGYGSGLSLEQLEKKISKEGYDASSQINVVNVEGVYYIIEGHHRNFATAHLGKTLIPFEVIATDDEKLICGSTARQRAESCSLRYLNGHEMFFDTPNEMFSYESIYPQKVEQLKAERMPGERY